MKKSFLKLNINKEDRDLNDFIYSWDFFSTRPNKTTLLTSFSSDIFHLFIERNSIVKVSTHTEIYPLGDEDLINVKVFSKYNDNIFISYTEYDTEHEESIVNEVSLFHKDVESDDLTKLLDDLFSISDKIQLDEQTETQNTKIISFGPNGFELSKIEFANIDLENFDLYYNDETLSKVSKLEKNVKKNKKGITIFYGERGTGKTSLVQKVSLDTSKNIIFIPCTLFETTINNPDFRTFLKTNSNSLLILDDSELFFSEIYSKSNIFTNNLLQLVDGLDSDNLNVHIFIILNVKDIDEVDHILLESNNLIDVIDFENLNVIKGKELSKHIGRRTKIKSSTKLIDILKKRNPIETNKEIGF